MVSYGQSMNIATLSNLYKLSGLQYSLSKVIRVMLAAIPLDQC